MRSWTFIVALWLLLFVTIFAGGCTQGQLAPGNIKLNCDAAWSDAKTTAAECRSPASTLTDAQKLAKALKALDNIGGTPGYVKDGTACPYEDGFLSPVSAWFHGMKSKAAK